MNILIIELKSGGHYPIYLRWIAEGAIRYGHNVIVAASHRCLSHPHISTLKDEHPDLKWIVVDNEQVKPGLFRSLAPSLQYKLGHHANLKQIFRRARQQYEIDQVFVPYIDSLFKGVALFGSPFGSVSWSGIMMRGSFHFKDMGIQAPNTSFGWIKKQIFLRALGIPTLKHVYTIDESLYQYMSTALPSLSHSSIRYLPDPVEIRGSITRSEARRQLGIPEDVPLVLVYGGLMPRKGILSLIRAVTENGACSQMHVLLAGKQGRRLEVQLESDEHVATLKAQGRLHELKYFIKSEEECCVFRAADIVWVGYEGHFWMSGVLVLAGIMDVPVIGCSEGVIGWWIRNHHVGICFQSPSSASIGEALRKLITEKSSFGDPERAASFARDHSIAHAQEVLFSEGSSDRVGSTCIAGMACQRNPL